MNSPLRTLTTQLFLGVVLAALSACGGTAWNTQIAETPVVRRLMIESIRVGQTTEQDFVTRWGQPTQKTRQGGQTEFIYRNMIDRHPQWAVQFGDSEAWVIVTFQYGVAIAARSNDTEVCRATFPPRPPGPGFNNPAVIAPVGTCPGLFRPHVGPIPIIDPMTGEVVMSEGMATEASAADPDGNAVYADDMSALGEKPD